MTQKNKQTKDTLQSEQPLTSEPATITEIIIEYNMYDFIRLLEEYILKGFRTSPEHPPITGIGYYTITLFKSI